MKKILLVAPIPIPQQGKVGGIGTWTVQILKAFENESRCHLLHLNSSDYRRSVTNRSLFYRLFYGITGLRTQIGNIIDKARTEKVNVVHFTSSASFGLVRDYLILRKLQSLGISSIIHFRFGRIPELVEKKNWEWMLIKKVIVMSSKTIVLDRKSYNTLHNAGFNNIICLPNPISLDNFIRKNIDGNNFEERNDHEVLYVGHIIPAKGLVELVSACAKLDDVHSLKIIGPYEPEFIESLTKMIPQGKGKNWLQVCGFMDKNAILQHMSRCGVFVLPSYTEGFPNVLLEAMITGCPIVSTKVGAIDEMLDSDTDKPAGICVEPKNVKQLKDAIAFMINNRETAAIMGARARDKVLKEYSLDKIANRLIDIWNETK